MKTFSTFLPFFQAVGIALMLGFITSGCDVVEGPYRVDPTVNPGGPDTTGTDPTDTTGVINPVRKVLLQEFTGHKCGFCPAGADKAMELQGLYGNRLVVMSVHAGHFASVNQSGKFTYDFRTPAGTALDAQYGVTSYPSAIINRTNGQIFGSSAWATVIDTILNRAPQAHIAITPTLQEGTRTLNVTVKTTFLQALSRPQNLTVYLTESGKISWQKDYRVQPDSDVENYRHDHFLRATLTGNWGDMLNSGPVAADDSYTKQYTYQIPAGFDISKCKIIAVVNDPVNFVVMQAEESNYLQ